MGRGTKQVEVWGGQVLRGTCTCLLLLFAQHLRVFTLSKNSSSCLIGTPGSSIRLEVKGKLH